MESKKNSLTDDQIRFIQNTKPNILVPIITSVVALGIFVFILIMFIKGYVSNWILYIGIFILIAMPATSWYSNFFFKKKTRNQYLDIKAETNQMLEYAKTLKGFKNVQHNEDENSFRVEYKEDINLTSIKYDDKKNEVNPQFDFTKLVSFGVSFFGFSINKLNRVYQTVGFLPKTTFIYRSFNIPESKKGEIYYNNDFNEYTIINLLTEDKNYFDKKTGWLYIGQMNTLRKNIYTDSVLVNNDTIVLLNNNQIVGVLVHLVK